MFQAKYKPAINTMKKILIQIVWHHRLKIYQKRCLDM